MTFPCSGKPPLMVLHKQNAKWDWGRGLWKGRKEWDQNEILNEATNSSLQLDVRIFFSLHHWHRNVLWCPSCYSSTSAYYQSKECF